jgi:hypothetical protein
MSFSWNQMTPSQHAEYEGMLGSTVVDAGGMLWRRARPFFYRPLQQWREFNPTSLRLPRSARIGGAQCAVPSVQEANSHLNFFVFDNTRDYSLAILDHNRRRQVRRASEQFVVRTVVDAGEFKTNAYPLYCSFQERTGYHVGEDRQYPAHFARWTDGLFQIPTLLVLGGYLKDELRGISISFLIKDTVVLASWFWATDALRTFLPDLMLHSIREAAAASPGVTTVLLGAYTGDRGVDGFKVIRGATLVRRRAVLQMNPLANAFVRRFLPAHHARLLGNLSDEELLWANHGKQPAAQANSQPASPCNS